MFHQQHQIIHLMQQLCHLYLWQIQRGWQHFHLRRQPLKLDQKLIGSNLLVIIRFLRRYRWLCLLQHGVNLIRLRRQLLRLPRIFKELLLLQYTISYMFLRLIMQIPWQQQDFLQLIQLNREDCSLLHSQQLSKQQLIHLQRLLIRSIIIIILQRVNIMHQVMQLFLQYKIKSQPLLFQFIQRDLI